MEGPGAGSGLTEWHSSKLIVQSVSTLCILGSDLVQLNNVENKEQV